MRPKPSPGCRAYDLAKLGMFCADEISDTSVEGRRHVIKRMADAAKAQRGWKDDPSKRFWRNSREHHAELVRILLREMTDLKAIERELEAA